MTSAETGTGTATKGRVLVVDDEANIADMISIALRYSDLRG